MTQRNENLKKSSPGYYWMREARRALEGRPSEGRTQTDLYRVIEILGEKLLNAEARLESRVTFPMIHIGADIQSAIQELYDEGEREKFHLCIKGLENIADVPRRVRLRNETQIRLASIEMTPIGTFAIYEMFQNEREEY